MIARWSRDLLILNLLSGNVWIHAFSCFCLNFKRVVQVFMQGATEHEHESFLMTEDLAVYFSFNNQK